MTNWDIGFDCPNYKSVSGLALDASAAAQGSKAATMIGLDLQLQCMASIFERFCIQ